MQIIVLVDKQGATQTIVKGAKGSSCVNATEFLHSALGTVTQDIPTEEYYEPAQQTTQNQQYAYQQAQQISQDRQYINQGIYRKP